MNRSLFEALLAQGPFSESEHKSMRHLFTVFEMRYGKIVDGTLVGIDFRSYCAALCGFVEGPLSTRIARAFQVYVLDDFIESRMDEKTMESILLVLAEFIQTIWEEAVGKHHSQKGHLHPYKALSPAGSDIDPQEMSSSLSIPGPGPLPAIIEPNIEWMGSIASTLGSQALSIPSATSSSAHVSHLVPMGNTNGLSLAEEDRESLDRLFKSILDPLKA